MRIFETHAHLNFEDYDQDRELVLKKAAQAGVELFINVGCDVVTSQQSIALAKRYPQIYASVGFHPSEVGSFDLSYLKEWIKEEKVVAIGEIGLDYYRNHFPKKLQQQVMDEQVAFAVSQDIPIVIHDRDAHEDVYDILRNNNAKKVVFHCFTGDVSFAEKVLAEDWYISFTGIITYKNTDMVDVARIVPAKRFFVETDCPYLTPVPYRGKRNSPEYLPYIVQKISDIKHVAPKQIAEQAFLNAEAFFIKKT